MPDISPARRMSFSLSRRMGEGRGEGSLVVIHLNSFITNECHPFLHLTCSAERRFLS
jgi:hypothetical protein